MEVTDKRRFEANGETKPFAIVEAEYDSFRPTLAGCQTVFDALLLRELKLPEDGLIASPDAYAEPTLFGEVMAECAKHGFFKGDIVRFLKGTGTTIEFEDGVAGQRYLTIAAQDVICRWSK